MRLLFVVHRYAPYPGGSEYYVQNMAEEMLKRKHEVTVLAHEHKGDYNGVIASNDYNTILNQPWDLIIVHGGDVIPHLWILSILESLSKNTKHAVSAMALFLTDIIEQTYPKRKSLYQQEDSGIIRQ